MDREWIERYAAGADLFTSAIAGLTREELNSFPVPGTWSIQQIVLHMLDSDLIASERMKRIVAEDNPLLIGYDETRFSQKLHYDQMDPHLAGEVFAGNRRLTAALLRRLPDEAFQRAAIHNERGKVTLADLVKIYAEHPHHHLKFLLEKRRLLGKPLT